MMQGCVPQILQQLYAFRNRTVAVYEIGRRLGMTSPAASLSFAISYGLQPNLEGSNIPCL
jgi:hypothetical protein